MGRIGSGWMASSPFIILLCLTSWVVADSLYDSSDPILELDNDTFNKTVYGQKKAFFIEFYSSWCGACIAYAPTFKKFARQLESWSPIVQVTVVNCADDKNLPLCREHQIAAFPTLKYLPYNCQSSSDAILFQGDKHDLPNLSLQVAQLVHDNWKTERPPEWPLFESIDATTTLREIWSASEKANIVALCSQEDPALLAWALTINFAGDKRVRTAIARPNHAEVLKEVGSVIDGKLLIFERNSARPVYVSPEKQSLSDMQEKVRELLSEALGHSLDQKEGGTVNQAPPPPGPSGHKKYDAAVWNDLSQFQLQNVDVESALAYMLTREIPRRQSITGSDLKALKKWIEVLAKYAPGRAPIRRLLLRLHEWMLQHDDTITADAWTNQITSLQSELGNPLPSEINWLSCKGSKPNLRGYTCGVWTLAHAIAVEAHKKESSNLAFNSVSSVLDPFRQFIVRFLSCGECAQNFDKEAIKHNIESAIRPDDMVLWLWNTHNSVNTRLSGAPAEDPKHPKRTFPPKEMCTQCYKSDGGFDRAEMLRFLLEYYGNVKNDPVKSDPEYTVKTFQDGKVKEAEKRHFNPRFGVHGAENIEDLEKGEKRLQKEQIDTSPLRAGRQIEEFKRELLGDETSPRANHPYLVLILSVIAFLVIFAYCKYRRNRSKFWKTFYYSNDFKLPWRSDSPKEYTA